MLSVDGKEVDRKTIPHTIPIIMTNDETFDIGVDTYTGVDDFEYQLPFRFTGAIDKLTYKLGPEPLSAEEKAPRPKYSRQPETRRPGKRASVGRTDQIPGGASFKRRPGKFAANLRF